MKRAVYIFCLVLFCQTAFSQVMLETVVIPAYSKNLAVTPALRYYYYPNLGAYYDLKSGNYIYNVGGVWVTESSMPFNYRGYSMHNYDRLAITDYYGDKPYELLAEHRKMYPANYFSGRLRKYEIAKSAGLFDSNK